MKAFALLSTLIVLGCSQEASSEDYYYLTCPKIVRWHCMPEVQLGINGRYHRIMVWRPEYVIHEKPLVELLPPVDNGVHSLPPAPRPKLSCGTPQNEQLQKNVEVPKAPPSTLKELDGPTLPGIPDSRQNDGKIRI